jgi:hypothetical protein
MTTQVFDIEKVLNNPNYRVSIHLGSGRSNIVTGYMTENIRMGGGNEWNNPFESSVQNAMSEVYSKVAPILSKGMSSITGEQETLAFTSLKSMEQTVVGWTGSKKPSFSVPLVFVATRPTDDVTDPIKKLATAVFPSEKRLGSGRIGVGVTQAPLGYGVTIGQSGLIPKGVVTLKIGRWFFATKQVINNVDWTFSKETIKSGLPFMATVTVDLEPFRAITLKEFFGYFNAGSSL